MELQPELLIRSSSEGMLMLDNDGFIQYINDAVTGITGFSEEVGSPGTELEFAL